jgi:hypothetical protein
MTFVKDVYLAALWSMLGGLAGWLVFLTLASVAHGSLPKEGDFRAILFTPVGGLLAGVVIGLLVRTSVGQVARQWLWALGFFILGAVVGPLALIILVGLAVKALA